MSKRLLWFGLWLIPCAAWDTKPHQQITRAALDAAPQVLAGRLGAEAAQLAEIYCIYPDRYLEMTRYGFVRQSPGPRTPGEIRAYCVRPDGLVIHGISGDRKEDLATVAYLLERMVASLKQRRPEEAAKFAGVLSHFVADSLSPPHSVSAERLAELAPDAGQINLHSALERSLPEFHIDARQPAKATTLQAAAAEIVRACYAGAERNRADLAPMLRAAVARDEGSLDTYRLKAGQQAAEILAESFAQWSRLVTPL